MRVFGLPVQREAGIEVEGLAVGEQMPMFALHRVFPCQALVSMVDCNPSPAAWIKVPA